MMSNGSGTHPRIGVMYDRGLPPEGLPEFARRVEEAGADELWVVEDLGWAAGVSAATAALAVTDRLRVGIGITPAPLRNPALLAMELATVARLFPGRLTAGVGHGVREWMAQVGAAPASPLSLLGETVTAVRGLLRGETVTVQGREVRMDGVRLVHPPAQVPDVVVGVVRPRSLELSGRVADGTILVEGSGPEDIAAARRLIAKGQAEAGATTRPHSVTVFTHLCVGDAGRPVLEAAVADQAPWLGRAPEQVFTASGPGGTAAEAAARVRELWEGGANSVVLRPAGPDPIGQLEAVVAELS